MDDGSAQQPVLDQSDWTQGLGGGYTHLHRLNRPPHTHTHSGRDLLHGILVYKPYNKRRFILRLADDDETLSLSLTASLPGGARCPLSLSETPRPNCSRRAGVADTGVGV